MQEARETSNQGASTHLVMYGSSTLPAFPMITAGCWTSATMRSMLASRATEMKSDAAQARRAHSLLPHRSELACTFCQKPYAWERDGAKPTQRAASVCGGHEREGEEARSDAG